VKEFSSVGGVKGAHTKLEGGVIRQYFFQRSLQRSYRERVGVYLSELRRDFLASIGITYAVFRITKSRLRGFGEIC